MAEDFQFLDGILFIGNQKYHRYTGLTVCTDGYTQSFVCATKKKTGCTAKAILRWKKTTRVCTRPAIHGSVKDTLQSSVQYLKTMFQFQNT